MKKKVDQSEAAKEQKEELITKSTLKQVYHLTDKQIAELPIFKEVLNPYYSKAAPMKLYSKATVEEFVTSPEFQQSLKKREKLFVSAKKTAERKREQTKQNIKEFARGLTVKKIALPELRKLTLEAKQAWYDYTEQSWNKGYCAEQAPEPVVQRWMVNYIRHNLVEYDEGCDRLFGKTGCQEAHILLKSIILDKIADVYPDLAGEALKQRRESEAHTDLPYLKKQTGD